MSTSPHDGSIDFSGYSLAQLQELQFTLDHSAFPQNYANLLSELERRQAPDPPQPVADVGVAGRFTVHDGLRGWLEARRKHLPTYGAGAIEATATDVVLRGWQRTWLGVPLQAETVVPLAGVRNAAQDGERVRFELKRQYWRARQIEFTAVSAEQARALVARLPPAQTPGFERSWSELRDFNRRLSEVSGRLWVTHALVIANILVFLAMTIAATRLAPFENQRLLNWGANFGPLTINGQWWRLISALFVHQTVLHLALNMWALWNVGRLVERLYGAGIFAFVFFVAGALGSLATIAWNPSLSSVGASGAIFGLLGALLAFLARGKNQVPASIFRAHWISTLAFVLFNLINGGMAEGIDNAAHVGGLISGFVVGWLTARPLDIGQRAPFPLRQIAAGTTFAVLVILAALWQVRGTGGQLTIPEQYFRAHAWYLNGEATNLRLWQELALRAGAGNISDAELSERFEKDILPFWKMANERVGKEASSIPVAQQAFAALVADFVRLRLDWTRALIDSAKNRDPARAADSRRLMVETDRVQARLERAGMRARMDHRPRALENSAPVVRIRRLFSFKSMDCVREPAAYGPQVAVTDARSDGPAASDAAGCLAQRLFMSGDYAALDSMMKRATASLSNLPDGSSTLGALYGGLSDLIRFGGLQMEQVLGYTSDWRRAVRGSVEPELVEAILFREWAWSARGTGSVGQVSQQAWAAFAHRTEMAATGLREAEQAATSHPVWYQLSLGIGLDQSLELPELRRLFDRGRGKFPGYQPLYGVMLRILMPRWLGSTAKVDDFINEMSGFRGASQDLALYAELYWVYSSLEYDETNIFEGGRARWPAMQQGLKELAERYPKSDYVLNGSAKFACVSGDAEAYRAVRPLIEKRRSATAWSDAVKIEACDKKMPAVRSRTAGS